MSNHLHSVSIHFACTLVTSAKRNGIDYLQILNFAGLNEKMLDNPKLRITPDQLSRMMQAFWRQADDEFMCMGSSPCRHGIFTLMAKQAVQCKDLRQVYRHLSRFYSLVSEAIELDFIQAGEEAKLSMRLTNPEADPESTLREFLLMLWHRFPSWLIGKRIPLRGICFDFDKPRHHAEFNLMFPCQVTYNQSDCSLFFDADMLDKPVVQTASNLKPYLRRAPLDWFKKQTYYQTYTRYIVEYLESSKDALTHSGMEDVAATLHMTPRNLRRKLAEEGTSFQKLKDDVRRDAAIHLLSQSATSLSLIASSLGYSEEAAFNRAFKQWTGVTPGVYRRF